MSVSIVAEQRHRHAKPHLSDIGNLHGIAPRRQVCLLLPRQVTRQVHGAQVLCGAAKLQYDGRGEFVLCRARALVDLEDVYRVPLPFALCLHT